MAKAKKVNVDKRVEYWLPICPAADCQIQMADGIPVATVSCLYCWDAAGMLGSYTGTVLCYSATVQPVLRVQPFIF